MLLGQLTYYTVIPSRYKKATETSLYHSLAHLQTPKKFPLLRWPLGIGCQGQAQPGADIYLSMVNDQDHTTELFEVKCRKKITKNDVVKALNKFERSSDDWEKPKCLIRQSIF